MHNSDNVAELHSLITRVTACTSVSVRLSVMRTKNQNRAWKQKKFRGAMDFLRRILVEELAFEGNRGMEWPVLIGRIQHRSTESRLPGLVEIELETIRDELVTEGLVRQTGNGNYSLMDNETRLMVLGVAQLPMVSENPQTMRILEMIARAREKGAWSYSMCSALKIDAKQLFHLSSSLVDFKLIQRFANVPVPRHLRSHTAATHSSFFILSRFSKASITDPDVADVVDPTHSTDNVCALVLTLLKEAGGVMVAAALRIAVVTQGGFTSKQYRRGKQKLTNNKRIETFLISKSDMEIDDDYDDEDEDEKIDFSKFVHGIRLMDDVVGNHHFEGEVTAASIKLEEELPTPPESEFEDSAPTSVSSDYSTLMMIRNLIRSKISFREAILMIIEAGGTSGVTTKDISNLTGIGTKEILKAMETIRNSPEIEIAWRNDGRKKYIVYKKVKGRPPPEIQTEDLGGQIPTPRPSKGYVTDQTIHRSSIAGDIVQARVALSLIDLGRAIEAHEMAEGTGIPGAQIDRRTLKKICAIAEIPLVEKGDVASSKLIIAFDSSQITAEEAMRRVERPLGITPKSTAGITIKPSLLTPSSVSSVEVSKAPLSRRKLNITEVLSRGRLAALAVFGRSALSTSVAPTFPQAQMYGLIKGGGEVYKGKLLHQFLVSTFGPGTTVSLEGMVQAMPLVLFLQVIGCGRPHVFIDAFVSSASAAVDLTIRDLPEEVGDHLKHSVPSSNVSRSPEKQLARVLAIPTRLGLVRFERGLYSVQTQAGGVLGEDLEMDRIRIDFDSVDQYWTLLHKACMTYREQHGVNASPPGVPPQLFRAQQWRCKVQVTLAQRRDLESLLRSFMERVSTLSSSEIPLVVDGSNEEVGTTCTKTKLDISTGLKALRTLNRMINPQSENILFAAVQQARFSCPHCGQIFFQLSSIKRHLETVHSEQGVPEDIADFTRPEYLNAISNLRSIKKNKRDRRRRRKKNRRRDTTERCSAAESIEVKAFYLACDLTGVEKNCDIRDIDSSHPVWSVVCQITGDSELSPELVKMKLVSLVSVGGERQDQLGSGGILQTESADATIGRVMIMNRILDIDLNQIQAKWGSSVDSHLQVWHKRGLLAIERKVAGTGARVFTLSRQGRIDLFGKFSEIDKFCSVIASRHASLDQLVVVEVEDDLDAVVNAKILDRLVDSVDRIDCFFEEETGIIEPSTGDIQEEGEDFKGIKKHIELAGPVSIDRIEISAVSNKSQSKAGDRLIEILLRLHSSPQSQVWRPTALLAAFPSDEKLLDEAQRPWSAAELGSAYALVEGLMVTIPKPIQAVLHPLVRTLMNISPTFFAVVSGTETSIPLATWTSLDGDVRPEIVADLLIHVLYLCYAFPGMSEVGIQKRLRLVPLVETRILVQVWKDAGMVIAHEGQLFLNPIYSW